MDPGPSKRVSIPLRINEIDSVSESRFVLKDQELNRVLGGGLVLGSVVLLGGEPGIGKSTLLLQMALNISQNVLYVSGEESQKQIKMRAERINPENDSCYILTETKTQNIFKQIQPVKPDMVIIDSIQTLHSDYIESSAGSISQIKQCATELIKFAKETSIPVFLVVYHQGREYCWPKDSRAYGGYGPSIRRRPESRIQDPART